MSLTHMLPFSLPYLCPDSGSGDAEAPTATHAQPAAAEHGTPTPAFDMFACDSCPACGAVVELEEVRSGWRVDEQVCCTNVFCAPPSSCTRARIHARAYTHAHARARKHARTRTRAHTHTHTHTHTHMAWRLTRAATGLHHRVRQVPPTLRGPLHCAALYLAAALHRPAPLPREQFAARCGRCRKIRGCRGRGGGRRRGEQEGCV